jgi:riboflavin kinase/FMN adenylyltransferase
MMVCKDIENLPHWERPVVAVGAFDGVHLGHVRILHFLREQADEVGGTSVVVTFDPHPRKVLYPDTDFFTINTMEENFRQMSAHGVDAVVVIPFTTDFSQISYQQFVQDFLIGRIHAHTLVMGPNHAFGRHREGHHDNIKAFCNSHALKVVEIPERMWHNAGVHSAVIRDHIRQKDWKTVNAMLGYPYSNVE